MRVQLLACLQSIDAYVKHAYGAWCESSKEQIALLLRQSVLGPPLLDAPLKARDVLPDAAGGTRTKSGLLLATAAASAAVVTYPQLYALDKEAARLAPPPYYVNYSVRDGAGLSR